MTPFDLDSLRFAEAVWGHDLDMASTTSGSVREVAGNGNGSSDFAVSLHLQGGDGASNVGAFVNPFVSVTDAGAGANVKSKKTMRRAFPTANSDGLRVMHVFGSGSASSNMKGKAMNALASTWRRLESKLEHVKRT